MKYRWLLSPTQPLLTSQLARQLQIPLLLAQCLVNRELQDPGLIGGFLEPRLKNLADPFLLPDMATAVGRLFKARELSERVVIFGDYDVDGVTSTALLVQFLRALGWDIEYYLPQRLTEGYGLTTESVGRCLGKTAGRVLLAVDCGSSSGDCIQLLQNQGIDVLVLDHHEVSTPPPAALALVNPHRPTVPPGLEGQQAVGVGPRPNQSFHELCSVGLAFKLAHAVLKAARQANLPGAADYDLRPLLDLVALGTIADLVPLTGENRILVSAGLHRLNHTSRPGLVALKAVARCATPLTAHDVGYQLGPRLNAAGRLETAETALELLLADRADRAQALAQALDEQNRDRQKLERTIAEDALNRVRARFNPKEDFVIVEGDAGWHVGVVGIVASRVLRQFHRPTLIVGGDGVQCRGSGRSIAGFNLAAALAECSELLVRHGGHAMAAGVTLDRQNIELLRSRLNDVARRALKPDQLEPSLMLDAEVALKELSLGCMQCLDRLNPTGQGNPPVLLCARNLRHHRPLQRVGADKQHVKLWVTDGAVIHEAMWWGGGKESLPVGVFDLAFIPQRNDFMGNCSVQLKVLDWVPSQTAPAAVQ